MKLLICMITHDRLAYTQRTLFSLRHSLGENFDYCLWIVDNASTDDTRGWIERTYGRRIIDNYISNEENNYPGKACNQGWEAGLKHYKATHLMRLDNDMEFQKGWLREVEDYFHAIPELGQLGLDHEAIEHPEADKYRKTINGMTINEWPGCVGGPSIIRRKIWDDGVRWPELRWDDGRKSPMQEDMRFSKLIKDKGYLVGHAQTELARTFATKANRSDYPDYYKKTMTDRGYE